MNREVNRPMTAAVLDPPAARQEAPPSMPNAPIDREALALVREERYQRRRARLYADTNLDPRLRRLFLDRELWGTAEIMAFLDLVQKARMSVLRKTSRIYGTEPHPGVLPTMDAALSDSDARPRPAIEAGRVREWAFDDHRVIWNSETGELERNPVWRAGRRRNPLSKSPKYTPTGRDGRRASRGISRPRPKPKKKPDADSPDES